MFEIVDAPKLRPHCHGLVESGNVVARGKGRWENGIQFSPIGCYSLGGMEADCPPIGPKELEVCVPVVEFRPYVLTMGLDWAANSGDDPKDVATTSLEAGTSAKLEEFLWSGADLGDGPRNPRLIEGESVTGSDARDLIGEVESAMLAAPTGGAGTLYMSPAMAVEAADLFVEKEGKLYTKTTCSLVIVGNFLGDAVAGHVGEVDLYLGDIFFTDTRDEYRKNEYPVMAERLAIAAYNSCASFFGTIDG